MASLSRREPKVEEFYIKVQNYYPQVSEIDLTNVLGYRQTEEKLFAASRTSAEFKLILLLAD
jgi:hypothetical protein